MPAQTTCSRCHRIGFVRFEYVIAKGRAYRHYFCGACDHTWQIDGTEPRPPADPPDQRPRDRAIKRSGS